MIFDAIVQKSTQIGQRLVQKHWQITTAESCTGGLIASALTEVPGSSLWFEQGIVSYSNAVKMRLLHVKEATLEQYGAVSEEVAKEMALGAKALTQAQIALSVTGIAGPGGGTKDKPVGTVCFAFALDDNLLSMTQYFDGDRQAIRLSSVQFALDTLLKHL